MKRNAIDLTLEGIPRDGLVCFARDMRLKADMLAQTAKAIASALHSGVRLVVVHGAGSFGHGDARRYRVKAGFFPDSEQNDGAPLPPSEKTFGFATVRRSVTRLNHHVVEALVKEGVSAVAMPPFPAWELNDGAVTAHNIEKVVQALDQGLVPVLHGDAVLDSARGCTILSGDTILEQLASTLKPTSAVFLTDVAGVYDRPPSKDGSSETATLLKSLPVDSSGKVDLPATSNDDQHDVTGGMQLKLQSAATIAAGGAPVHIVQVATESATAALCGSVPLIGSTIALRT